MNTFLLILCVSAVGLKIRSPSEQLAENTEPATSNTVAQNMVENSQSINAEPMNSRLSPAQSLSLADEADLARAESVGEDSKVQYHTEEHFQFFQHAISPENEKKSWTVPESIYHLKRLAKVILNLYI